MREIDVVGETVGVNVGVGVIDGLVVGVGVDVGVGVTETEEVGERDEDDVRKGLETSSL